MTRRGSALRESKREAVAVEVGVLRLAGRPPAGLVGVTRRRRPGTGFTLAAMRRCKLRLHADGSVVDPQVPGGVEATETRAEAAWLM